MPEDHYIDVVLPLAVPQLFTYAVPPGMEASVVPGKRVVVHFRNKLYTALVKQVHRTHPVQYEPKVMETVLDEAPVVNEKQLRFWEWMAEYYLCTLGEVMNAALPSGLKLSSETRLIPGENISAAEGQAPEGSLFDDEYFVLEALRSKGSLSMDQLSELVPKKKIIPMVQSLLEKGRVHIHEELKEKYKPRTATFVRLTSFADEEGNLKEIIRLLEKNKRTEKQLELLMNFIRLSNRYSNDRAEVRKTDLLHSIGAPDSAVNALVKKDVFALYEKETGRLHFAEGEGVAKKLNEEQEEVFRSLKKQSRDKEVSLLHGVTSSGKTEIYVKLIEETIAQGRQVLYLLPEIALTTQIISRLQKYFGGKVGVYHSRFSENERVEIWNNVLHNKNYQVILGARSSVFLPFNNLGLIIADEEHDTSFKQFDPAPHYNARDAAVFLASLHGAKTLLGSATPSVETYFNARSGKFGFSEIKTRYGGVLMPEISVVDVREHEKTKEMKSHFSPSLLNGIQAALDNKEQVILFQNRRGFAPYLECGTCVWTPMCRNCDVSLTYHKAIDKLRCHYCGYSIKPPPKCGRCGDTHLQLKGFGTEKVEDELQVFFPNARIARMDLDTTRSKFAYRQIIYDFEERNIDILVGTQMVTKGLDFDNVALVGILNADSLLNFPDFRSFERAYQLMAQVAGRAGRKQKQGRVIVQTRDPQHRIIQNVINNDYEKMYSSELLERQKFAYPPFYRLIEITVKHREKDKLKKVAAYLAAELRKKFGKLVLGPEFPLVPRISNYYLNTILLKFERHSNITKSKSELSSFLLSLRHSSEFRQARIAVDVDPL